MTIKPYKRLMKDLDDLAVAAEPRDEETVSYEQMKRRLNKDGLL